MVVICGLLGVILLLTMASAENFAVLITVSNGTNFTIESTNVTYHYNDSWLSNSTEWNTTVVPDEMAYVYGVTNASNQTTYYSDGAGSGGGGGGVVIPLTDNMSIAFSDAHTQQLFQTETKDKYASMFGIILPRLIPDWVPFFGGLPGDAQMIVIACVAYYFMMRKTHKKVLGTKRFKKVPRDEDEDEDTDENNVPIKRKSIFG
jgi:hypothetical protein